MRPGRIIAVIIGTILAVIGALILAAAVAAFAIAGGDNAVATGEQRLSTPTAAITSGSAELENERPAGWLLRDGDELALRITASSPAGAQLFLGVGPTADVERYLEQTPHDEIDDFSVDPFSVDYDRKGPVDGGAQPAPPGEQQFWTVQDEGTSGTVQLDWDYEPGSYTIVLMNADASSNVAADTSLELEVPFLRAGLITAMVIGGLVFVTGLVIALFVGRRRKTPPAPQPPPPAPSASPPSGSVSSEPPV